MDAKDTQLATVNPAANYLGLSFADIKNVATALAASGIFDDAREANIAFAKILAGQEMGLTPFKAMQELSFIKGKPSLSANAKAAAIKSGGKYDYRVLRKDSTGCELQFFEHGKAVGKQAYTEEDARRSGVYDRNPNYKTNPEAMYFAGALRQGQRTYAPDATSGISTYDREEIIEIEATEVSNAKTLPTEGVPVVGNLTEDDIHPSFKTEEERQAAADKAMADYDANVEMITAPQRAKIFAVLSHEKNITDKNQQKSVIQGLSKASFGLDLESTNDLSKVQATDLIEELMKADPEALVIFFAEPEPPKKKEETAKKESANTPL